MNVLIAPDKFKGSLTALDVCDIMQSAIRENYPEHEVAVVPLSDGGEGTAELLTLHSKGEFIQLPVYDPLMRQIESGYGMSGDAKTAFIEMARASGLQLLTLGERNCLITSTYGTGQLIKDALDKGVEHIVMGVGGSATNDAGAGMARALGYILHGDYGTLSGVGADLVKLRHIDGNGAHPRIISVAFTVLCDVDNPLYGPQGAAYVFGKQKGASAEEIELLDKGLRNFAMITRSMNCEPDFPGAGAAGGLGAGARVFLNAHVKKGIDYMVAFTGLEQQIEKADIVISGEGKIDNQTLSGKVVKGVADLARKHKKKFITVSGALDLTGTQIETLGIAQAITLSGQDVDEQSAIRDARLLLRKKTADIQFHD